MSDIKKIIQSLNPIDKRMLKSIYDFRCLTINTIYKEFYKKYSISYDVFYKKRIVFFQRLNIITTKDSYSNQRAVFLTDLGVDIVRNSFKLPKEIFDYNLNKTIDLNLTANKLDLHSRLIDHQLALNEFALDALKYIKNNYPDIKYNFYGEKIVSMPLIRPDGIIRLNGLDILLEMDMGTESKKQLIEKWNAYRLFNRQWAKKFNRNFIVLFIVDCDKIEQRCDLIRYTAKNTFIDLIENQFDVYIGNKNEIMGALTKKIMPIYTNSYTIMTKFFNKILKGRHGFTCSKSNKIKLSLDNISYGYYIRKKNTEGKIIVSNGVVQEFLFDNYLYSPLSVLGKIELAERTSSQFKIRYNRNINYIVLVTDINVLYRHLKSVDIFDTNNVFFTTVNRLGRLPFHQALFKIDKNGNIYHCKDESYTQLEYENTLNT